MAIQNRRGLKKDFDPTKMLPGEFAVSIDSETENQIVWMCFAPGVVKRIGTYEDFRKYLDENCKTAYEYAVDGGYTGTEDEFKAKMAQECADAIVASSSGTLITLSDSAEAKLKGLLVHGKSTQDGTPTPSAPIEIVNAGKYNEATGKYDVDVIVSGRNLFDKTTITPHAYIQDLDGSLNIMTDSSNSLYNYQNASDFVNITGLKKIYVSPAQGQSEWGAFYDADKNYISGVISWGMVKDVPEGACYARFTVASTVLDTFMVTAGDTLLDYEPYRPVQTVTLSLSEPIRSLPDGTSDIVHVDRATGTAWVERKVIEYVFDGSSDEVWYEGVGASKIRYNSTILVQGKSADNILCTHFKALLYGYNRDDGNNTISFKSDCATLAICTDEFENISAWKTWLSQNPITIQYALATPTTEELSAETASQLLESTSYYPNTVVYNDQGTDMEVEYVADTKNYIDGLVKTLKTAIIALGGSV